MNVIKKKTVILKVVIVTFLAFVVGISSAEQATLGMQIGLNGDTVSMAKMPRELFPSYGKIAEFSFNDESKTNDLVKAGRKFKVGGVPPRWNEYQSADNLVKDGALHVSGEYNYKTIPHLDVPELRYDRFALAISFQPQQEHGKSMPLVSFGGGWRWFHILLSSDGTPQVAFRGLVKRELSFPLAGKIHPGTWNWIVVSFDGSARSLFVILNGRKLPEIALPSDFAFSLNRVERDKHRSIQLANTNNGTVFKGAVNGFLLFNRALTKDELEAIASAHETPSGSWIFHLDDECAVSYWNGTFSDGEVTLDARLANNVAFVSFPDRLSIPNPNKILDLRKPFVSLNGIMVPIIGIGEEYAGFHVGYGGIRRDAKEVYLPDTLQFIGPGAFERFVSLTDFICPDSVRSIASASFNGCRCLRRVRLGKSLESFSSDRVFMGCEALEAIDIDPKNCHFKSVNGVLLTADGKRLLAFPPGYKGAFSIPSGVEDIPARAFLGCHGLTRVFVPASVKKIGEYAFADCPTLEMIEFENQSFKLDDKVFGSSVRRKENRHPATNLMNR
ncbi:MAG: leucine-rich repeat protein [Victivallales bacterium]|nr:leucine-rich repeat protein [Victivallales bacterium]